MKIPRDGFEAAAWRRRIWLALWNTSAAMSDYSTPAAETRAYEAINTHGYVVDDGLRLSRGTRPMMAQRWIDWSGNTPTRIA